MERCPRCGADLPDAGQVCPACLLSLAAGDGPGSGAASNGAPEAPRAIGPYRLLERLGEGGMGIVYLAEQREPIRRRVAIKLLRRELASGDVLARFEVERQVLALLRHPGIAQVHDAGTSPEGNPYIVMEYVPGLPITDYCDRRRLSVPTRLELFVRVCQAVQHAHQRSIVHRDLKPSNILVTEDGDEPVPKVIDFGVAKAIQPRLTERTLFTQHGALVGTPEYMSPEQADPTHLDVDTRTDIYALGVVLYELLTGALPFDPERIGREGLVEMLRVIREVEPARPSQRAGSAAAAARQCDAATLARLLRGDLDWIVLKTLEKDRNRRYASASELAGDVRRYLDHQPVSAAPPSFAYRTRKFARRHRLAAALLVAMATGLVAFTTLAALHSARLARERDRAVVAEMRALAEREAAERAIAFLVDLIETGDANRAGPGASAIPGILRQAEARILDLGGRPALQARAYRTMGGACRRTHRYQLAQRAFARAVEIYRSIGERGLDLADGLLELGEVSGLLGDHATARPLLAEGLEIRRALLGTEHPEVGEAERSLAAALAREGDGEGALLRFERAAAMHARLLPAEDPRRIDSELALAGALALGDAPRARSLLAGSAPAGARAFASDPLRLAAHWFRVAAVERAAGDEARAREAERLALAGVGDQSAVLARADELEREAGRLAAQGANVAAAARLRIAVGIRQLHLGDRHPGSAASLVTLAALHLAAGDAESAVDAVVRALHAGAPPSDLANDPRLAALAADGRMRVLLAGFATAR